MSTTHLHLLLNHFPIVGTFIGMALLIYAVLRKNQSLQKASLWVVVVMSLMAIPVFLTGEPAEDSVKNISGISKALIEEHEEAAEIAFWAMLFAGAISLVSLMLNYLQSGLAGRFTVLALFVGIISFALMARTGYLGGQIRHTEISGNPIPINNSIENQTGESDDD